MPDGKKMLIHVLISMTGLLAMSGCMDLSGMEKIFPDPDPARLTAPLPAVAAKLVGAWTVDSPLPSGEKRDFAFPSKRYDGPHSSKAEKMFGFAACWDTVLDGHLTGYGFWGESPERAGEFVVYVHVSSIVYNRLGTIKVDDDRATLVFESGQTMSLRRTSTDPDAGKLKEATGAKPQ